MRRDDIVRLRHMLDAAREAQGFAASRSPHGYFDIDPDIVWSTMTDDLPPLAAKLERTVASTFK